MVLARKLLVTLFSTILGCSAQKSPEGPGGGNGTTTTDAGGASSAAPEDGLVPATSESLAFFGRWSTDGDARVGNWGVLGFRAKFKSSLVRVLLEDEQLSLGAEGTGNVYQYSLDGGPMQLLLPGKETTHLLAENLSTEVHELLFVRRTESKFGKTTLRGLVLDGNSELMLPEPKKLRLEFFGDSITAGLANEDEGLYTNKTENGYEAYGPVLARLLDAEFHVEARGGGAFFGSWLPMPPWFDLAFGPENKVHFPEENALPWDFSRYQPDALVIALGTNDVSEMYPHIDEELYVTAYSSFLKQLRGYYPKTDIFCLAPFKPGAPWDEVRAFIPLAVSAAGDAHITAIDPVGKNQGDAWLVAPDDYVRGDAYHPNIQGHRKIAEKLAPLLRERLSAVP